jgi:hypothetical protein
MLTHILRRLNDELEKALVHALNFCCYGGRSSSSDKFALTPSIGLKDLNSDPTLQCTTNNASVIANAECKLSDKSGEQENEHKCSTSKPTYNHLRQTTLWEFIKGEGAIAECNCDKGTGDLEIMEWVEVMRDHDNYRKDELISQLHLNNRQGLNQLTKHYPTKSLIDYICKDINAEAADNITPHNEDGSEEEADEPDLEEQS